MDKDDDLDQRKKECDVESLTPKQENNLLADSSHVSAATAEVQAGTSTNQPTQGDILPSSLMLSDYSLNTSNVQLGIDTTSAKHLPLPVSEDDAPSNTKKGLDVPCNEEGMDVVLETTGDE